MSASATEPISGLDDPPPTTFVETSGSDWGRQDNHRFLTPDQTTVSGSLPPVNRLTSKGSFTPYHKPLRSDTPTSSSSRSAISPRDHADRSTTPSDSSSVTGVIGIGMALGSPTHAPDPVMQSWPPFMPTVTTTVEAMSVNKDDSLKAKPRKWGIFTRSWPKRPRASDVGSKDEPIGSRSACPAQRSGRQRNDNIQDVRDVSSPRQKSMARSRTSPGWSERTAASGPFATRRAAGKTGTGRPDSRGVDSASSGAPSPDQLLNITFPDVTMERYSVMFGHLIEDRPTASLLERRQATRDKMKIVQEDAQQSAVVEPPTILVSANNGLPMRLAPPEPSPGPWLSSRQRSHTFPATLSSPSQADNKAGAGARNGSGTHLHVAAASARHGGGQDGEASSATLPGEPPRLMSKFHRRSSSHQGVGPTSSPRAADARQRSPSAGPKLSAQTWNTAHPPLSTPQSAPRQPPAAFPLSVSPAAAGPASDTEADQVPVQDLVELSIARQISVSRQQRALLGPLQRSSSRRVNEAKSSTPRIDDPRRSPERSPALHHVSERVVVEGA